MQTSNSLTSTCSNCRFFNPEGHLHGSCHQLHVTVDGDWPACSLGAPAFLQIAELLTTIDLDLHVAGIPATADLSREYAGINH
jgi:hypothetical protein